MADNANSTPTANHSPQHHNCIPKNPTGSSNNPPQHSHHHHQHPSNGHRNGTSDCSALSNGIPNHENTSVAQGAPQQRTTGTTTARKEYPNSKIAVMQLFHEMKQTFATVPDYLVGQYVADNAHDRAALLSQLGAEAARAGAGTVQAYPQALRNQSHYGAGSVAAVTFPVAAAADVVQSSTIELKSSPTTTNNQTPTKPSHNNNPTDASTNANPTIPNHSNVNHHSFNQRFKQPHIIIGPQQQLPNSGVATAPATASSAISTPRRPHRLPPSPPRRSRPMWEQSHAQMRNEQQSSDGEWQQLPSPPLSFTQMNEFSSRRRSRSTSRSHGDNLHSNGSSNSDKNDDDGNNETNSSTNCSGTSKTQTATSALDLRTSHPSDTSAINPPFPQAPNHQKPKVPERPRTLTIPPQRPPPPFNAPIFQPTAASRAHPIRPAPRPPVEAPLSFIATSSSPPPSSSSAINVSVNVTVSQTNGYTPTAAIAASSSPSSASSPLLSTSSSAMSTPSYAPSPSQSPAHYHRRTIRHTTELSLQPERWPLVSAVQEHQIGSGSTCAILAPHSAMQTSAALSDVAAGLVGSDGTPMRSFTSVQFKLRSPAQTSDTAETSFSHMRPTAASPIDISAGPSLLTYSSASYDARKGLHSNFQITVDGGRNGMISAMRTRPNYAARPPPMLPALSTTTTTQTTPTTTNNTSTTTQLTVASSIGLTASSTTTATSAAQQPQHQQQPYAPIHALMHQQQQQQHHHHQQPMSRSVGVVGSVGGNCPSWDEADIVHRQLLCKQRLCVELENDRKRLMRMQHEIQTLRSPIPEGGANRLEDEILRLQSSCKQMVQQVEEAGPYVLGETNEAFYHQIMSTQTFGRAAASSPLRPPLHPPTRLPDSPNTAAPPKSLPSQQPYFSHPQQQQHHKEQQQQQHYSSLQPSSVSSSSSIFAPTAVTDVETAAPSAAAAAAQLPWACNMCTFQNHPLLNKCEQCEMPLLTTSGTVSTQTIPCVSFASLLSSASAAANVASSPVNNNSHNHNNAMFAQVDSSRAAGSLSRTMTP